MQAHQEKLAKAHGSTVFFRPRNAIKRISDTVD